MLKKKQQNFCTFVLEVTKYFTLSWNYSLAVKKLGGYTEMLLFSIINSIIISRFVVYTLMGQKLGIKSISGLHVVHVQLFRHMLDYCMLKCVHINRIKR